MYDTIYKLYLGEIQAGGRGCSKNEKYQRAGALYCKLEGELMQSLHGKQREQFEQICNTLSELHCIEHRLMFVDGFRLGMRIAAESFLPQETEEHR